RKLLLLISSNSAAAVCMAALLVGAAMYTRLGSGAAVSPQIHWQRSDAALSTVFAMGSMTMFRDTQMQAILLGIALVSALAWWALIVDMPMSAIMLCGNDGIGSSIPAWNLNRLMSLMGMWAAMTLAMMLPGATLAILRASWDRRSQAGAYATASSFAAGYLAIILPGSVLAAFAQWCLESTGAMAGGATIGNSLFSGLLLAAVGLYQVSPFKRSLTPSCYRDDCRGGTFEGLRHGRACFGCCAGMICLQFAGGAMNLAWMAILALWMMAETALPWKRHVAVLSGLALLTAGGLTIGQSVF
ncbi:MAG: DUF2182 domain-containing protein, partial [Rhizobiaceae bacterium]|nr:DUF2182 domain-containing protein [Rhizobiaceae bacterium]